MTDELELNTKYFIKDIDESGQWDGETYVPDAYFLVLTKCSEDSYYVGGYKGISVSPNYRNMPGIFFPEELGSRVYE